MALYRVTKWNHPNGLRVTYETDDYPKRDTLYMSVEVLHAIDGRLLEEALEKMDAVE
jgi:hypothetical protein